MMEIQISEKSASADLPWADLIAIIPHLLWIALLLYVFRKIGWSNLVGLLHRIQKIGVAGVDIEFKEDLELASKAHGINVTSRELGRAAHRLALQRSLIDGARLLWIDDVPSNNRFEIAMLQSIGAHIDVETTSAAARTAINRTIYDLVISDMARADDQKGGLAFADEIVQQKRPPPLIFYVSNAQKPVPASAFGITDKPDELVHLILDALARVRS